MASLPDHWPRGTLSGIASPLRSHPRQARTSPLRGVSGAGPAKGLPVIGMITGAGRRKKPPAGGALHSDAINEPLTTTFLPPSALSSSIPACVDDNSPVRQNDRNLIRRGLPGAAVQSGLRNGDQAIRDNAQLFQPLRVKSAGGPSSEPAAHVCFALKADRYANVSASPLCANFRHR